jgi:hypothetical protein
MVEAKVEVQVEEIGIIRGKTKDPLQTVSCLLSEVMREVVRS